MNLSRSKPAIQSQKIRKDIFTNRSEVPDLHDLLDRRDYTGAITLLQFERSCGKSNLELDLWIAYSLFHLGDYKKAAEEYDKLRKKPESPTEVSLYLGCCYFFLGMYKDTMSLVKDGPINRLQNRLMFHLAHKFKDDRALLNHHNTLENVLEDQLTLASISSLKNHHQEAIDIYKNIILENRKYIALNVYIALCYYKIGYFEISQEVLGIYLQHYPDSFTAINLKACINFQLYNAKAAENELKALQNLASPSFTYAKELIKHNIVVFRRGEGATSILPSLIDVLPEARLNLAIFHLNHDEIDQAYATMKDVEPANNQEYVLKAIVCAIIGQEQKSNEHVKMAQQYFQLIGGSSDECDTMLGRQCMSSCFFLSKQFDNVLIYLNSIRNYLCNDDTFNFNYGQAKAARGSFKEAQEAFLLVQSDTIKNDYTYLAWLTRCHIMNRQPKLAWELYVNMDKSPESFRLLQLIANDCYRMGQFYYAAKAFDNLEKINPNLDYWKGKRGACVGQFQLVLNKEEPEETMRDILHFLRNTNKQYQRQADYFIQIISKWLRDKTKN